MSRLCKILVRLFSLTSIVFVPCGVCAQGEVPEPGAMTPGVDDDGTGIVWVKIPGGAFEMGSNGGAENESPMHYVNISTFEIGKTEVTVAQYAKCVEAGGCTAPGTGDACNWGKAERSNHPVNCVNWAQARAFAMWAGGRLPSEAEWEYAGRGAGDSRKYAWGDEKPDCSRAVMAEASQGCGQGSTWAVCSKPSGNTKHGLCDMSGNVWEWCADWYDAKYYGMSPKDNPQGPDAGVYRVVRGGSWFYEATSLAVRHRLANSVDNEGADCGFRVVRNLK